MNFAYNTAYKFYGKSNKTRKAIDTIGCLVGIIFILIFISCKETPTEPKYHFNISGKWVTNDIELNIAQNGINLTGRALRGKDVYSLVGSNENTDKIFIHLIQDEKTKLTFAGMVIMFKSENTMYAFPKKIQGTIKENNSVAEITFNKVN